MVDQRVQDDEVEAAIAAREALRPTVWTGHLILYGTDAERSATFYEIVGKRRVAVMAPFAVMELRGGTHLVIRTAEKPAPEAAPFDFMVDDLPATREKFGAAGVPMSGVSRDELNTHDQFTITDPDGNTITVKDSHVVGPA